MSDWGPRIAGTDVGVVGVLTGAARTRVVGTKVPVVARRAARTIHVTKIKFWNTGPTDALVDNLVVVLTGAGFAAATTTCVRPARSNVATLA